MLRLLIGFLLLPTAGLSLFQAARALGGLAERSSASYPFLAGLSLAVMAWLFFRYAVEEERGPARWAGALSSRFYVLGHELTHAVAAWASGAKVLGFRAGESSGHVDLSHSNAAVALAPYCVPFYTLALVLAWRLLAWVKPAWAHPQLFLLLMGMSLSYHILKTFESLWDHSQPDLEAAGGVVFSLAWIGIVNGLVVMLLAKGLFPGAVSLGENLLTVGRGTAGFWTAGWAFVRPLKTSFPAQMR